MNDSATARPIPFSLALGALAGAAMIATTMLTHRGPAIFITYALLIIATGVFLKLGAVAPFARRFSMALGAFMTATMVLYLYIGTVATGHLASLSLLGHAWRIGLMLAIGSALSAAVAQLTARNA